MVADWTSEVEQSGDQRSRFLARSSGAGTSGLKMTSEVEQGGYQQIKDGCLRLV